MARWTGTRSSWSWRSAIRSRSSYEAGGSIGFPRVRSTADLRPSRARDARTLRVAPRPREQRACLVDRDVPQREHVFVGALIQAAVVAVAEVRAQRDGVEQAHLGEIDH